MSRVTLDERVFGERRLHQLADLMNWSIREAIGSLVLLWHESQAAKRISASADEIANWAWISDGDLKHDFVKALLGVGYVHNCSNSEQLIIHGNERHLANLAAYEAKSSKGGLAKASKHKQLLLEAEKILPVAEKLLPNSIQFNSIQDNTIAPNGACRPGVDLSAIWNSYCHPLPKVSRLNDSRRRQMKIRLNENSDPEYWGGLVKRMAASTFCCQGQWATFDWLMKNDTNHVKITEGKFDNKISESQLRPSQLFGRMSHEKDE